MHIDQYAVFGNPIAHSLSPFIHHAFAKASQQTLNYKAILAPKENVFDVLDTFFAQGGKGCNITTPFKEQAYAFCSHLTSRAKKAQAVNTIKLTDQGFLGDNTDGIGLLNDLRHYIDVTDKHILILGAGGATRGILAPLINAKVSAITIANRTVEKAAQLCQDFAEPHIFLKAIELSTLQEGTFDLIIQATSSHLQQTTLSLSDNLFKATTLVYDMAYQATPTAFLQQAAKCNASYQVDGLGMLVHQAAEAFYFWRGIYPATDEVLRTLRTQLHKDTLI